MAAPQIRHLRDVSQERAPSRARLLAPLRYLFISHPEKVKYDIVFPIVMAFAAWSAYWLISPKPALFGEEGLLRFSRDLLIMAVPFMIGSLAAVAMGSPGDHLDKRPRGVELRLDGRVLTLRQFVCYLLGYLSFVGMVTLVAVVTAQLMHGAVLSWTGHSQQTLHVVKLIGTFALSALLSILVAAVLWSLYFLTDIVNQKD
jgi:hypothetical protein